MKGKKENSPFLFNLFFFIPHMFVEKKMTVSFFCQCVSVWTVRLCVCGCFFVSVYGHRVANESHSLSKIHTTCTEHGVTLNHQRVNGMAKTSGWIRSTSKNDRWFAFLIFFVCFCYSFDQFSFRAFVFVSRRWTGYFSFFATSAKIFQMVHEKGKNRTGVIHLVWICFPQRLPPCLSVCLCVRGFSNTSTTLSYFRLLLFAWLSSW